MVYGSEVVLPTELQYGSPRVQAYQLDEAEEAQWVVIDFLKESTNIVVARSVRYQQMLRQYHARRVHSQGFHVGNLVLHRVQIKKGKHKLTSPWEGPYLVVEVI
jgi:hypothetical protein